MLLCLPARPAVNSFRAWVSIDGIAAAAGCLLVLLVSFSLSLWKVCMGLPDACLCLQDDSTRPGGQFDCEGHAICRLASVRQKTDVLG